MKEMYFVVRVWYKNKLLEANGRWKCHVEIVGTIKKCLYIYIYIMFGRVYSSQVQSKLLPESSSYTVIR